MTNPNHIELCFWKEEKKGMERFPDHMTDSMHFNLFEQTRMTMQRCLITIMTYSIEKYPFDTEMKINLYKLQIWSKTNWLIKL